MDLQTICGSVIQGKTVHWSNENYVVIRDDIGQWMIQCVKNGHCIGLTWSDGSTLNGKEEDFYVAVSETERMREALLDLATEVRAVADSLVRNTIDPWADSETTRLNNIADHMVKAARS